MKLKVVTGIVLTMLLLLVASQTGVSAGAARARCPPWPVSIYTDKYSYSAGEIMHLGLNMNNPLKRPITVCIAIWPEKPSGPIYLLLHVHNVSLPARFTYSNPDFETFVLPAIPPGNYTWHAAFLKPTNHQIVVQDTAEWQFS